MDESEILETLEAWREQHGLSKKALSDLFGLKSSQTYGNWLGRRSIPKRHLARAIAIPKASSPDIARKASSRLNIEYAEKLDRIPTRVDNPYLTKAKAELLFDLVEEEDLLELIIEYLEHTDLGREQRRRILSALLEG